MIYNTTESLQHDVFLCFVPDHDVGSVYRKSAEFGPQPTMGCCGGVPTRLRSHADETVAGELKSLQVGQGGQDHLFAAVHHWCNAAV